MGEWRVLFFLKAFIDALFLTHRNLVNFIHCQRQGNDRCLWCVFMHSVAIGEHPNIVALWCVIHNSVGSALLVLTVMGIPEPLCVGRVTVQFLRFFISINAGFGAAGALKH